MSHRSSQSWDSSTVETKSIILEWGSDSLVQTSRIAYADPMHDAEEVSGGEGATHNAAIGHHSTLPGFQMSISPRRILPLPHHGAGGTGK